MRVHYSAPGKLLISGEWSVLEPGNKAVVAAVNSRVHVYVEPLAGYNGISITAKDFKISDARAKLAGGKIVFMNIDDKDKETLKLLGEAITVAVSYAEEKGLKFLPFKITTESSDMHVAGKKVGFGSSAAVVVAGIASVLDFLGCKASHEEVYKLSAIAHYFGQGKVGSAFDIAASTYGGVFVYSRFDPEWLANKLENEPLSKVVSEKWPGFYAEELEIPAGFHLLVGWTKEPASTSAMVKQMNEFKSSNRERYYELIDEIASIAEGVAEAWKNADKEKILLLLRKNEDLLAALGRESNVQIETQDLRKLSELADSCGAAGKLSGAGGGDCGIAVCFDKKTEAKVKEEWEKSGIKVLDVEIDYNGVKRE